MIQAELALVSVRRQLDALAQAEQAWLRDPRRPTYRSLPAPVQELFRREALLRGQAAKLSADIRMSRDKTPGATSNGPVVRVGASTSAADQDITMAIARNVLKLVN